MDNSQNGSVEGAEVVAQERSLAERLRIIYCANDDLDPCGVCLTCRAANEIEKLQEQVNLAHAILSSESAGWLIIGSNHEESHRLQLSSAAQEYWDKYGSFFKKGESVD